MKKIGVPSRGWEGHTWYLIDVAFAENNIIHRALFFTGFVTEAGVPSGYNAIVSLNGSYDRKLEMSDAYYLMPIKKLFSSEDLGLESIQRTPADLKA